MDQVYNTIINHLYQRINEDAASIEKGYLEQMEYYTMWVHQIKTPISAMRLALQGMEASGSKNVLDQELFKIEQYVEMALQYIKINQLSADLIINEYELYDIVTASVKKYATLFICKKLSVTISPFQYKALTDSKWIAFILEQLLSNAIKYTSQGGITIHMEEDSLLIEDSGIGIHKEDIERIFEKGYTGYNGRLDKKASGIGLYLVKKVADSLSVQVSIHSQVGRGTQVILTFPKRNETIL